MGEDCYIEKLSDYIDYIENLDSKFCLSRGQGKLYDLLPGALRKKEGKQLYTKNEIEEYLNELKLNAYNFLETQIDIKDELEWMLYAQHYGLPTRLLDFTKSHIISLMFAVEKAFESGEDGDGVVYFLNPTELNLKNLEKKKICQEHSELSKSSGPIVVQSRKINKRVQAQNGLFVYFNYNDLPLNEEKNEEIIKRVIIKKDSKKSILSSLFNLGIGFSNLYPELNYLVKDILMRKTIEQYVKEAE